MYISCLIYFNQSANGMCSTQRCIIPTLSRPWQFSIFYLINVFQVVVLAVAFNRSRYINARYFTFHLQLSESPVSIPRYPCCYWNTSHTFATLVCLDCPALHYPLPLRYERNCSLYLFHSLLNSIGAVEIYITDAQIEIDPFQDWHLSFLPGDSFFSVPLLGRSYSSQ